MIQGFKGVKYGLTVPASKKKQVPAVKIGKLAAFGDDDSDGEHDAVPQQLARQAASKKSNNKVAEMHAAALAEDASVFDYDGVYDSIQDERAAPLKAAHAARSSKYIEGLLDKAEERKREQDIIFERRQVKERQAEDHLFGDKEKFVTAAYKKKLQEQKLWEARQKLKDERDEANAAEKRGDMSGFYGNLLTKNVAFGTSSAKKLSEAEAKRDELRTAAAVSARSSSPTAATSPPHAAEDGATPQQPSGQSRAADTRGSSNDDGSPKQVAREPSGGTAAAPAAAPAGDAGGAAESKAAAQPPPPHAPPVRHTDEAAKQAARERYLARKKRKAAGEPDT